MGKDYIRRAHHAGSWYSDDHHQLNNELQSYLNGVVENEEEARLPRAIIAPHAGYSYSGPTAAYAYIHLKEALEQGWHGTVVVLHPSHHVHLDGCAVSGANEIETPINNIPVDNTLRLELLQTGEFSTMSQRTDENEHSGEMQYPFISKVFTDFQADTTTNTTTNQNQNQTSLQILPIMVGAISKQDHEHFGKLLAPILSRPNIFTVISTDFCHWGTRFGYAPTNPPNNNSNDSNNSSTGTSSSNRNSSGRQSFHEIHEFIQWLDQLGMDKITLQDPGAFAQYMKQYKNTICGRYPIGVYLNALSVAAAGGKESGSSEKVTIEFVKYAQSSQVRRLDESSVSYASAVMRKCS